MATVGYGEVRPGVDAFWGRIAATIIACFLMLLLPLLIETIVGSHAGRIALEMSTPRYEDGGEEMLGTIPT